MDEPKDLSPAGDEQDKSNQPTSLPEKRYSVSRRKFFKLVGAAALAAGASGALLEACTPSNPAESIAPGAPGLISASPNYPEVPDAPTVTPQASVLRFFTPDEAKTVDAIVSRIYPGTQDDPGAHELEVAIYIDRMLAWANNNGFVEPTYFKPPFAKPYEGDTPPAPDDAKTVYVKITELDRYGFQSGKPPQDTYRSGIQGVNKYCQQKFQKNFADLSPDQQDTVLNEMDHAQAKGVDSTNGAAFFKLLREDTINGLFSDPAYGGNRDMMGWSQIGYPGAQRAYTPVDIHDEKHIRPPQSLAMLHNFHPGQNANPNVIVPPSGSSLDNSPQK